MQKNTVISSSVTTTIILSKKKTKTKNKKRITITIKNITNLWDQENSAVCMYISKEFFLDYLLIIY